MKTYKDIDSFSVWKPEERDDFSVRVLKGVILDGIRKANSGHSGGPLSSIDFSFILFSEYLNFDPEDPDWFGRDRFVLSAGHESMLLYTLLFMIGWLSMDDLKQFRQFNSKTPGHPEVSIPGVEATTGPLGQGVGMGIACPPIKFPDFYGIDMPSKKELLASNKNLSEMCDYIKADSLKFLSLEGLYRAACSQNRNKLYPQFTDHYFTGEYPVDLTDHVKDHKITQLSLLSGKSTS